MSRLVFFFSENKKKKIKLSSVLVVIGALRVTVKKLKYLVYCADDLRFLFASDRIFFLL